MTRKPPKPRACKMCKTHFAPVRPLQKVCGPKCAIELGKIAQAKKDAQAERRKRMETRKALAALKGLPDLVREAQTAFNAYIRLRDEGLPCICCGRLSGTASRGGEWDAGHYRSRGAAPHLRFDERNCHRQLKHCNRYAAGNVVGYRKGLIARIGLAAVEALECDNAPRKLTREQLIEIRDTYRAKARELMAGRKVAA